jgi:pyruvate,orthophosphate dikinase
MHEFLPTEKQLIAELAQLERLRQTVAGTAVLQSAVDTMYRASQSKPDIGHMADPQLVEKIIAQKKTVLRKVRALTEVNPMLGHRGVRLGLSHPEIYAMQIRAILEAAAECAKDGIEVHPEIMVPQVATAEELRRVKKYVKSIKKAVEAAYNTKVSFKFGSMLEVVRACMRAGNIAEEAEFFSFGTNDLSQAVFSFSREDAENKFLPMYTESQILRDNPFEVLDVMGVGKLMEIAVEWGREKKPGMKIGICGEHGGHPSSIAFCHSIGLTYVSCSASRVPIARLAAAQAALQGDG